MVCAQAPNATFNHRCRLCDNTREYKFKDFGAALKFVNKVGAIAEKEGHHPNIYIHNWNRLKLTNYTHFIHGLSENDFILAAKIDRIKCA